MKEIRSENKTSKLIFDMRVVRKLLKMNGEPKYCPYCGKLLTENCGCHKNMIIDVKKARGTEDATIAVFMNNESFQKDFASVMDDMKAKVDTKKESVITQEPEHIEMDLD